jgi:hypothetical protein
MGLILALSLFFALSVSALAAFQDTQGHALESKITQAETAGIVNGYPDGTFKPDAAVTKAEFVKMVLAAMKLTDGGETASWLKAASNDYYGSHKTAFAEIADSWLTEQGWSETVVNFGLIRIGEAFDPDKSITRSEAAAMLKTMLGQTDIPESVMTQTDSSDNIARAAAAEIVLKAQAYAERGVDTAIKVVVVTSDAERGGRDVELSVPVQVIDGIIFVPARSLFTAADELSADVSPNPNLVKWSPEGTFDFAVNFWYVTYTAGQTAIKTVLLNGRPDDSGFSWATAPHILRGELMIQVYPKPEANFAVPQMWSVYAEGTKTLEVRLPWIVQTPSS